jgi:hypothetical protein
VQTLKTNPPPQSGAKSNCPHATTPTATTTAATTPQGGSNDSRGRAGMGGGMGSNGGNAGNGGNGGNGRGGGDGGIGGPGGTAGRSLEPESPTSLTRRIAQPRRGPASPTELAVPGGTGARGGNLGGGASSSRQQALPSLRHSTNRVSAADVTKDLTPEQRIWLYKQQQRQVGSIVGDDASLGGSLRGSLGSRQRAAKPSPH